MLRGGGGNQGQEGGREREDTSLSFITFIHSFSFVTFSLYESLMSLVLTYTFTSVCEGGLVSNTYGVKWIWTFVDYINVIYLTPMKKT